MNESLKVQAHHLERDAYLYIRQSSMRQVIENVESTKRQYSLRSRATALGWLEERIVVIDSDQGESGASASWREGFKRLVTEVGMGRAGIVMGLEVSRLARNNADWHRLLEICALTETLILDEDGVYDPINFNDRLLLGLKGAMSEAELHVLKARLRGGILNKVRRGEYRCPLPTGLIYNDSGDVVLDPDSQVRETISYFFETFSRVGSASQTVKAFKKEGIRFPSRICRDGDSKVLFRPLSASTAIRTLHNPRYAGTYAYGRRRYRRTVDGKKIQTVRDCSEWIACIPDAHPGYITWDQYQENVKILESNGSGYELARKSPPREGVALLQGRAVCGKCGRQFRVRYAKRRGRNEAWYVCDRAGSLGEPNCQSIAGRPVDQAVGALIAERMTPKAIEMALEIRKEIENRQQEADLIRCQAMDRAQAEVDLAQRRFMMVDPNNRLVADTLEADWNQKLRILAEAQKERERYRQEDKTLADEAIRERLLTMTTDFKQLWSDPETPNREKKRMLAYLVEDATLIKFQDNAFTKIHIRFKGGKTETITTANPKTPGEQVKTSPEVVALIDRLLNDHIYSEIAEILNNRGFRPGGVARAGCKNKRFSAKRVAFIVHTYSLKSRYDRLRERGMLNCEEMAELLGVHSQTVKTWGKCGIVTRHAYNGHYWLFENPGPNPPTKHCSRWDRLADRAIAIQNAKENQGALMRPEEV